MQLTLVLKCMLCPQDRDAKVKYLKTVFEAVEAITGKSVPAAPVKVGLPFTLIWCLGKVSRLA